MLSVPALLMERSFLQLADGSPSGKYPKLRVTAIKLLCGTNRKLRESPLEPLRGWMQIFQFDEPDVHLFASLDAPRLPLASSQRGYYWLKA